MTLNYNLIAAISVGLLCGSVFTLDILFDRKRSRWPVLPFIIRWEIRITALVLFVRSINLFTLAAKEPGMVIGQVNGLAVICSLCLTCTVVSLVAYAFRLQLPAKAWDRIGFALRVMRKDPSAVPVMMSKTEVLDIHRAMGQAAVAGDNPEGVGREVVRFRRSASRR